MFTEVANMLLEAHCHLECIDSCEAGNSVELIDCPPTVINFMSMSIKTQAKHKLSKAVCPV